MSDQALFKDQTQSSPTFTFMTPTMAAGLIILVGAYFFGKRVTSIDTRLEAVEEEAKYSARDRAQRATKRDFWLSKVGPVLLGMGSLVIAFVAIGVPAGWFK